MADYPISNVPRRVVYAASGTGPYAFTFEILSQTDIDVYKGSTLLTLTTDYAVTINANGTGSVTLVLTAGTSNITIVGGRNVQRTTDFVTGGDFFANTLNDELDSQTIFIQQVAETAERGLKAPVIDPTDINMTLPAKASRGGTVLAFDTTTGNPIVGPTLAAVGTVSTNITNINTVATNIASVNTVSGNISNINTVAGISGSVTTVATNVANVNTVATNIADINQVAVNIADVNNYADTYLGAKVSDPSTRNDGSALLAGDLYFNTTSDHMRTFNGSAWIDYSATAEAAQTAAETARDAAQLAETNAETAETNAEAAQALAEAARDAAQLSETNAALAEINAEAARDAAFVNANVYANTTAGLAAVALSEQFQVVSGDEIIRYREDAGPVATEVARYPASAPIKEAFEFGTARQRYIDGMKSTGATLPKAAIVILLGQSLNAPRNAIVAAKGAPTAKMPFGGASIANWQFHATNVTWIGHWSELASAVDFEERTAQTPMVGVVNAITGGKFARTYIGSVAIGARTLEVLMTGGPVTNLWAMLQRLCTIARADGFDPEVMFYTAHGEANAAAATTEQAYYDLGVEYYGRAQLYASQAMRKPGYVAPIAFTYPAPGTINTLTYAEVKEAIRRLAANLPGGIDLGGIYQWPTESDRVHPTQVGYIQRGEAVGKVLREYAEQGKRWQGLHIIDVTLSGTEFVATFSAPVQRDDSIGAGQNLNTALAEDGFEWFDNGSQIGISAVVYEGWKVRGTLASAPAGTVSQQILRIASQTITSALVAGATNLPGSVVRAKGDSWQSIQNYSYENYIWAAPQVFDSVRAA